MKDNGRHFTVLLDLLTVMQCSFWTGLQTCLLISLVACSQVVSGTVRHTAASSVAQLVLYTVRHCSQSQVSIRVSVDQSQVSIHLLLLHGRALLPQRGDAASGGGDHRHTHALGHWHPVTNLAILTHIIFEDTNIFGISFFFHFTCFSFLTHFWTGTEVQTGLYWPYTCLHCFSYTSWQ